MPFAAQSRCRMAVGVLGKTDTARISNAFKARGNVDAVAHQVAIALLDHVAQMDADARCDAQAEDPRCARSFESDHIRRKKAASFRVSAMAVPSPHARLARLLIDLYRLWVQHLI